MTRLGLWWRMKLTLRSIYTDEFWERWKVPFAKDKSMLLQHKEECDALIGKIPNEYRAMFNTFLEHKQTYLIRSIAGSKDGESARIAKARLFQASIIKQQIEAVTLKEKEDLKRLELLAKKKNKKAPLNKL